MSKKKYIDELENRNVDLLLRLYASYRRNEELKKEIEELKKANTSYEKYRQEYEKWLSKLTGYKPFLEG